MEFRSTIKKKIFAVNVFAVVLLLCIIAVAFNITVRAYMERETMNQLQRVASRTAEEINRGLFIFRRNDKIPSIVGSYLSLVRVARQPQLMANAEIAIIDRDNNVFIPEGLNAESASFDQGIVSHILSQLAKKGGNEVTLQYAGDDYAAIAVPVEGDFPVNISKIIFYTSLDNIADLQKTINLILLAVSLFAAILVTILSSYLSKKISTPITQLCTHIRDLSERQFSRIHIPADDEILNLVENINTMTEKLESYDQAQKTFLQNASHELRTPIMSIRSYAEGMQYGVVENTEAVKVILDETTRLTQLVENLLYLSRLDSIDEPYHMEPLDFHELLHFCTVRMRAIAQKQQKDIFIHLEPESLKLFGDGEKLTRAVTNLLDNCIRYAQRRVVVDSCLYDSTHVQVMISDDGSGFDPQDLKQIFTRFYKGKKGHFGLGLSIVKSIIEKHHGTITAGNGTTGAFFKIILPITAAR